MDFLSRPGEGAYIELQAGVAPTQNQEFLLGPGDTLAWTECIAPVQIEPDAGHDIDYAVACDAMETVILDAVPDTVLAEKDAWLSRQVSVPVDRILWRGSVWGALHEKLTGRSISMGLQFDAASVDEGAMAPWIELLEDGTFSAKTLSQMPTAWAVSDRWLRRIQESAEIHGTTWLHELFLGVCLLDRDQRAQAKEHFESSVKMQDNYLAHRHLALIHELDGNADAAWQAYARAWDASDGLTQLAVEICRFLQEQGMDERLADFVDELPPEARMHERILLAQAQVAMREGDYAAVLDALDRPFATIREGETLLTDLWFAAHRQRCEAEIGRTLSAEEAAKVERQNSPPPQIDFRMKTALAEEDR